MTKVMLVEDDAVMSDLLNTLFRIEGFEVISIKKIDGFLPSVKENRPDLVLLDVNLKGGRQEITGFDLLKQIRMDDEVRHTRVVMSSGMDFGERSIAEGADGFVLKPYMPTDLLNLIKNLIARDVKSG